MIEDRVVLGHGAGGRKMHRLIRQLFLRYFANPALEPLADGAIIDTDAGRLCVTTDSYVVQPLFFPGGDIGRLAVTGTVNDLAVMGAVPQVLTLGMIIREGLRVDVLERICQSIAATAQEAGVTIAAGDTKVIEGGSGEELYINTTGIGFVDRKIRLGPEFVRSGDAILLNGGIGEHEAAVGIARSGYGSKTRIQSDCVPLNRLVAKVLAVGGVRVMRDPTRGGLATTLNEFSETTGLGFVINESALCLRKEVKALSALLGLDPLYMANEGKVVIIAAAEAAPRIVRCMRRLPTGKAAGLIGEVVRSPQGVWLRTRLGSLRPLMMLEGEQLPRIC
ncbi:MAG: hydrogenase expression/formation protein HypE [candidate division WOR-3 bacterium]